ncbi:hypothetical protein ACFQVA_00765 [Actinomadura keratinilytica]
MALPGLLDAYTISLAGSALALGLLAVSVTVLTGYAGLPTLGQTAPFAVGAYTTANLAAAAGPWAPCRSCSRRSPPRCSPPSPGPP